MYYSYHLNQPLLFRLMMAIVPESFYDLKASYSLSGRAG
jgi:hypothetical protein